MPKYFCDYCDTYLTHDSPSVRKTHCSGRKHRENVKFYYEKWYMKNMHKIQQQQQQPHFQAPRQPATLLPTPMSIPQATMPVGMPAVPPPSMAMNMMIPPPSMLNPHQPPPMTIPPPPSNMMAPPPPLPGMTLLPPPSLAIPPPGMMPTNIPPPGMTTSLLPPPTSLHQTITGSNNTQN